MQPRSIIAKRPPPRNVIISFNLGRTHKEWDSVEEALAEKHFKYVARSLDENLDAIDWRQVAAIELRECRGWQGRWNEFFEMLKKLQHIVDWEFANTGFGISIINSTETFKWGLSKENLAELSYFSIQTVPTLFLKSNEPFDIVDHMLAGNPQVVLKPSRGSAGKDVIFIKYLEEKGEFEVTSPKREDYPTPHKILLNAENLRLFFAGYKQKIEPPILIQKYIRGMETSAIALNGEQYFIDRPIQPNQYIAHEDFGGKNQVNLNPDAKLIKFANEIFNALPNAVKASPYCRMDILQDENSGEYFLLEVECGSARLFLIEANKVENYADMLEKRIKQSIRKSRTSTNEIINII